MEIHASSQTTYKTYRQSRLLSTYNGGDYKTFYTVQCTAVILCLSLLIFMLYKSGGWSISFYTWGIFLILIIALFPIIPKIEFRSQEKILTIPYDITFYEDEFRVVAKNAQFSSTKIIKYSFLDKVYETDETIYLYIDKVTTFPICKDNISLNEVDELRTRLLSLLRSDKYLRCE